MSREMELIDFSQYSANAKYGQIEKGIEPL